MSHSGLAAGAYGQPQRYDNVANGLHPIDPNQQISQGLVSPMSNRQSTGWQSQRPPASEMEGRGSGYYPMPQVHEVHGYGAGPHGMTELPG